MKPFNRNIAFIAILLFMSIGNYFRMSASAVNIRTIDFLSIFCNWSFSWVTYRAISITKAIRRIRSLQINLHFH